MKNASVIGKDVRTVRKSCAPPLFLVPLLFLSPFHLHTEEKREKITLFMFLVSVYEGESLRDTSLRQLA
jgi:hypothetical protein